MGSDTNVRSYHGCHVEAVEVAAPGPPWGYLVTTPAGQLHSWLGIASRKATRRGALHAARHAARRLTSPGHGVQLELPYEVF
jgi:hypothetical protein